MRTKKVVLFLILSMLCTSIHLSPVYADEPERIEKVDAIGVSYYVDSEDGNDDNDGLSQDRAFKTLAKINEIELQPGDAVLLKKGSEFYEQLKPKGRGTIDNPITITSYGETTDKPIIHGGGIIYPKAMNNTSATVLIENMEHVVISDLEVTNDDVFNLTDMANDPNNMRGNNQRRIGIHVTINEEADTFVANQRAWKNIKIENCYIHDVDGDEQRGSNKINGGIGVEVFFRNSNNVFPYFDGVTIESNTIEKVDRTGIKGIRLTELSLDDMDGGDGIRYNNVRASADKNQAGRNFVLRNNDLKNIGGDGILIDSTIKTVVERNVLYDHTKRSTLANAGIWCWNTQDVLFQYNESYGGPIYNQDGCSYDCDYFSAGTIFQYNYSHDTPMGFMLLMGGNEMDIVRYNISQDDGMAWRHFSGDSTTKSYIYNNAFYYDGAKWEWSKSSDLKNNYEFYNNVFYNYNTETPTTWGTETDWSKAVLGTNVVYEASGKEGENAIAGAIHANPEFKNPGSGGTKDWSTLEGYQLEDSSPLINTGSYVYLDMNGAKLLDERSYYTAKYDFYGNALYQGAPDIGVHESLSSNNNEFVIEDNATYRIIASDTQRYLQNDNGTAVLNSILQDNQECILVNSNNGYKIRLLDSGIDTLYLGISNGEVVFSEEATVWQIESVNNGLVKIQMNDQILTHQEQDISVATNELGNLQHWYLQLQDTSKSFNSGGDKVEGYSADQDWQEESKQPGRYGVIEEVAKNTIHTDVYTTAIKGDTIGYKFPIQKGSYNIKLSFQELEEVENRTFDIIINGEIYKEQYTIDSAKKIEEIGNVYPKNGIIDIQLLAAYNTNGEKTAALLNGISLERSSNSNVTLSLNCGASGIDGLSSDALFPTNGSGYYGESNEVNFARAGRPVPDGGMPSAMETGREGTEFGYKFKAQPGNYRLKCLFNEGEDTAQPGDRIFDIYVNDKLVQEDFDIVEMANGTRIGVDFTKMIKSENGEIDVKFVGKNGTKALVNAIIIDVLVKEETRENIVLNKPISGSSQENGNLIANYAVDGNQATRWGSGFADNQWIQVDMEKTYLLDTVFVDWTPGAYAKKYRVEVSMDSENWTLASYITDAKPGLNAISFSPVEGRYLRIFGENRNDSWGMSITELEAYGTEIKGEAEIVAKSVKTDDSYRVSLEAEHIYKRYTNMKVTLQYDSKQITYQGNEEYTNPNLTFISKNVNEEAGEITYVFEVKKAEAFEEVPEFITVDFQAVGSRSPITINATFSDAAAHVTQLPEIKIYLPDVITKMELGTLLDKANAVADKAVEGIYPGEYRGEDIAKYKESIATVQSVYDQEQSEQYSNAYSQLEEAIVNFEASVIEYQYQHYYQDYSVDTDFDFELQDSQASIVDGKLQITLDKAGATATDALAPKLESGTFIMKFDINNINDQIRFDIKNTADSRIEVGYENGRWFWGGATNGAWGYFPTNKDAILYTDRTNEVYIKFDKQDTGNTTVTLIVNNIEVGTIEAKFAEVAGSYCLWTRSSKKIIDVHEITYTNAPLYHIDISSSEGGKTNLTGQIRAFGETDKTIICTPDKGYEIDTVLVDGQEVDIQDNQYTFKFIQKSHTFAVQYKEVVVDKTALEAVIKEYESLNSDEYTVESYDVFEAAFTQANTIFEKSDATQKEVDDALEDLLIAIDGLVIKPVDTSNLESLIKEASELDKEKYTPESWSALEEVLSKASSLLEEENVTQEAINQALSDLQKAIDALEEKIVEPEVDTSKLESLINEVSKLDKEKYTVESWKALEEVLSKASSLLQEENVTQEAIDIAVSDLQKAIDALEEKVVEPGVDISKLESLINEVSKLDKEKYTVESWKALEEAVSKASSLLEEENVTQEAIDIAVLDLQKAIDDLEEKIVETEVDTSKLESLIKEVSKLDKEKYTLESWNALDEVLSKASSLLEEENVTQEAIDITVSDLQKAIDTLEEKIVEPEVDTSKLESLINEVSKLAKEKYTLESWKALEEALSKASSLLQEENVTQEEIDIAVLDLQKAVDALEEKVVEPEVDISKLESLIKEVSKLDKEEYTLESWKALEEVLSKALDVLQDENVTQEAIDIALSDLQKAIDNLITKKDNVVIPIPNNTIQKEPNTGDITSNTYAYLLFISMISGICISKKKRRILNK